ncbi:hypothetical protein [Streptomyces canus]|uniref:hypothetical protein n=1 Tax=Streptomyces canus TaxID=58343 RepID=UPI0027D90873|nr:hypothetical protein [Streptomyces canus]
MLLFNSMVSTVFVVFALIATGYRSAAAAAFISLRWMQTRWLASTAARMSGRHVSRFSAGHGS